MLAFCRFIGSSEFLQSGAIKAQLKEIQNNLIQHIAAQTDIGKYEEKGLMVVDLNTSEVDLYDRMNFLVLLFACCDEGFKPQVIVEILGEGAKHSIPLLLEAEMITEKPDGTLGIVQGSGLFFTATLIRFHMSDIVKFYKIIHRGKDRNFIFLGVQGVSAEGLRKIYEIHSEYACKIEEVLFDSKNWGPNPIFVTSCMDTFTHDIHS
jgi:hypothetical protein